MKQKLRLRQFEALMAVIQHSTVTLAAKEMGISQPAVSRLLADLGQTLGFSLFDRRGGRLVPTQEVRFLQTDIQRGDCSKSGGFALIASEKRLDRGLYGVVSLSAW
jgi:hypothetical protein